MGKGFSAVFWAGVIIVMVGDGTSDWRNGRIDQADISMKWENEAAPVDCWVFR